MDATCPLVSKVHAEARRFADDGYLVALIGHAGHEEVEGTIGEAPRSMVLVETETDVATLMPPQPGKVAYLMQTTLAADEASGIAEAITSRFPDARARAATTSATRPPTGRTRSARSPPSPTWCWSPGRRTRPTRSAWWNGQSGPGRPRT